MYHLETGRVPVLILIRFLAYVLSAWSVWASGMTASPSPSRTSMTRTVPNGSPER